MTDARPDILVRNVTPEDFAGIIDLTRRVYPQSAPWNERQLASHLDVFPEGQLVAIDERNGEVAGMAASLIVLWDDYDIAASWRDFTDAGMFTNHDPVHGRTLYGAEVMVDPALQGRGVGSRLYSARQALAERLSLLRIRAGARLRGYHLCAAAMSAQEYVERVVRGQIRDPTLSFQLARGFHVLDVVSGYLRHDPESLGWAAVIEWVNPAVATPADYRHGHPRYR
ncbi:MAG: acetyltransferase family protein [Geminicoccaceae bacterium]|nr:acetyltransferase family protein [Geminicoccaceae bacterium]